MTQAQSMPLPDTRLVPSGEPPVWSDKRQALCDSLPYYKTLQAGVYTKDLVTRGILINSEVAIRDMITSDVIITHIGGGKIKDKNGNTMRVKDPQSSHLVGTQTSWNKGLPVGIIVGNKCSALQVSAPHAYNVMDWFTITDMWIEKEMSETAGESSIFIYKIRLEKTVPSGNSWWVPTDALLTSSVAGNPRPLQRTECSTCKVISQRVFHEGWTCLNPKCSEHFLTGDEKMPLQTVEYTAPDAAVWAWCMACKLASKIIFSQGWTCMNRACEKAFTFPKIKDQAGNEKKFDCNALTYSSAFLQERTICGAPQESLVPALPTLHPDHSGTEAAYHQGLVCPKCQSCSRRIKWEGWFCENAECDFSLPAAPKLIELDHLAKERQDMNRRKTMKQVVIGDGIQASKLTIGSYTVEQYLLPDISEKLTTIGSVHVFRATTTTNSGTAGPDQLWHDLQQATSHDFGLNRNPVLNPGSKHEILTRQFQQNWGAPYKFVVNVLSKSFEEAPDLILHALMRMQWAGQESVMATSRASAAGIETGGMKHSERLSGDFLEFNELLSLGYMEGDRISWHDDGEKELGPTVATLSLGSPATMAFRLKLKFQSPSKRLLQFPLYHGDIVVMHGVEIHQFYDHSVENGGIRRFALTSRNIVLDKLSDDARLEAEKKGRLPARATNWTYNGQ